MRKVWMIEFRRPGGRVTRASFGIVKDRNRWLKDNREGLEEYFVLDPGPIVKVVR